MPVINSALGLVGLATRSQLDRAVDRKDRWHGLVREVFGQYYLKFRESSLGNMPELPSRYSADWESHIRAELDAFLGLDLESVGELLEVCGFGTQKWENLQVTGFPALRRLLDEIAETGEVPPTNGNGRAVVSDEALTQAVDEDVLDLLQQHPDLAEEMIRRIDLDSGRLLLDQADLEASESFRELQAHHEAALEELKRFRRGGRQALDRIHQLQGRIDELQNQPLELTGALPDTDPDQARELAALRKELRAREASSAALRGRCEALEAQLAAAADPDAALREELVASQEAMLERDDTIVRLQARIERLETQLEAVPADAVEDEQLRELRNQLKAREHEIEGLKSQLQAPQAPDADSAATGELERQIADLQSQLQARDHNLQALRQQLLQLQSDLETSREAGASSAATGDLEEQISELQSQLQARDHNIQSLREEVERLQSDAAVSRPETRVAEGEEEDPAQLRHLLAARETTITGLREEIARLEEELEFFLKTWAWRRYRSRRSGRPATIAQRPAGP